MVKFRGVEVCIVTQFDARRLPEFAHRTSPVGQYKATTATCYVPIYPGSQIWFEYSIEGPHPLGAAYFFKLFFNGKLITSWDCTAQHGYHGKTIYSLQPSQRQGMRSCLERQAFQFSNRIEDHYGANTADNDCIEIRVHRIEHRQRINTIEDTLTTGADNVTLNRLRTVDGGILEPGRLQRRFKYQLLDPLHEPYAIFRFMYREYEWLDRHGFIPTAPLYDDSFDSSALWYDPNAELPESSPSGFGSPTYSSRWKTATSRHTPSPEYKKPISPPMRGMFPAPYPSLHAKALDPEKSVYDLQFSSEESLSLVTKDSVEELPTMVSRSPQSSNKRNIRLRGGRLLGSPKRPSPLKQGEGYSGYSLETPACKPEPRGRRRPLSPFTNAGFLRKLISPTPPLNMFKANVGVAGAGHITDESCERSEQVTSPERGSWSKSPKLERGGRAFIKLLGHRCGRQSH